MNELHSSIDTFFASYAAAFNRFDLISIAKHYALPALLVHEKGQSIYEKPQQLTNKLKEVLRNYREFRYQLCQYEILAMLASSDDRVVCVTIKWTIIRDLPLPEIGFQTTYHVRRKNLAPDSAWAIVTVISLEEPGIVGAHS